MSKLEEKWFRFGKGLSQKRLKGLTIASFILPLLVWSVISYIPAFWHPEVEIIEAGDTSILKWAIGLSGKPLRSKMKSCARKRAR